MPQNKPLPLPPQRGPKVLSKIRRNTASTILSMPGLSPTSLEYSPLASPKPTRKSNKGLQMKYQLPTKRGEKDAKRDGSDAESEKGQPTTRPSLKGLTFRKSPRKILLERQLASLDQENTKLRRQLKLGKINNSKKKEELIALLHNQVQQHQRQIQQQNTVVTRIASKISTMFQEYQDMVGHADFLESKATKSDANKSDITKSSDNEFSVAGSDHIPTKVSHKISNLFRYNLNSDYSD
ncbi:hypothetical protein F4678DRAFT_467556 [Xylaria arbuscula]|nr:hypothetical protein F4678DRAFT_467556 [Xylaria arbuscula]